MSSEYNEATAKYYDLVLSPFLNPVRKKVAKTIKQLEVKNVIDLCCGTGHQLKFLKKHGITNITGVDLSPAMLQVAKEKNKIQDCIEGDASKTPYDDNSFDLSMVSFALHEKPMEVAQAIVDEARRITVKDGYLLVVDYIHDEKAKKLGRMATNWVEKMVGGEHYQNYLKYIKNKGWLTLFDKFELTNLDRFLYNSIGLFLFKVKK